MILLKRMKKYLYLHSSNVPYFIPPFDLICNLLFWWHVLTYWLFTSLSSYNFFGVANEYTLCNDKHDINLDQLSSKMISFHPCELSALLFILLFPMKEMLWISYDFAFTFVIHDNERARSKNVYILGKYCVISID